LCRARVRRRVLPPPRAPLSTVAAGGPGRGAARALRIDRARRPLRWRRAAAGLDVSGAAARRCIAVAARVGAAADAAAPVALGLAALIREAILEPPPVVHVPTPRLRRWWHELRHVRAAQSRARAFLFPPPSVARCTAGLR